MSACIVSASRRSVNGPSRVRRGEREARKARDDHMEVGQEVGELELQSEQVRPAVHHEQRGRVASLSAEVGEVDRRVVDVGEELRMRR